MRIVDVLERSPALTKGDARFMDLDNNVSLNYQEVLNVSLHIAALLTEKGVKPQDVVVTYAPNSVAAYCCIFAISQIGAVWLSLNARNTIEANLKLFNNSNAVMLLVDDSLFASIPELTDYQCIQFNGQQFDGHDIQSLGDTPVKSNQAELADDEKLLLSLFPTGGTTGDSKLAEWSSLTWQTMISIQMELMPNPDIPACNLISAPMTHAAGVSSFATMLQGASIVVMDGMVPEKLLSIIETYRITHLFLPPTAIYMLLTHDGVQDHDYSSLRYFWYAAAPMSVEKLKEAMATFGPVMVQTYGQAEAPMLCSCLSVQDHIEALEKDDFSMMRSCGKAPPQIELAIMDDEDALLPAGQEGEIVVRGKLLMRAYYNNPEETAAIRVDGWQRTGDIGVFDQKGYLSIVDRKRDMIISGGFNVYPSEIEQHLWAHPAIKDCAVIGIPDDKWGEQVTAVVELKDPNIKPDEQEIINYCKEKFGSVKTPKQILYWDELPRSPVGKVLKKDIRKIFWDKVDRKI
ncbi:MAG: AMP-binding protein [Gammaproteobacteria bacterium]|nr:AMP-binding protein [Gammaproteobacteria bacterium]